MSIFVDPDEVFEIKFLYKILTGDSGKTIGVQIYTENIHPGDDDEVQEFIGQFRGMLEYDKGEAFKEASSVMESRNEKAVIYLRPYRALLLAEVCKSWNLTQTNKDGEEEPLPITPQVFKQLPDNLTIYLYEVYKEKVGAKF